MPLYRIGATGPHRRLAAGILQRYRYARVRRHNRTVARGAVLSRVAAAVLVAAAFILTALLTPDVAAPRCQNAAARCELEAPQ